MNRNWVKQVRGEGNYRHHRLKILINSIILMELVNFWWQETLNEKQTFSYPIHCSHVFKWAHHGDTAHGSCRG
jgi:hypothetical protein